MVGIENAFTSGKKYVISMISSLSSGLSRIVAPDSNKAYFAHSDRLPYSLKDNCICPFCADMIKRKIGEGNRKGYPFPEDNHPFQLDSFNLLVTTRISVGTIEHFVEIKD